MKVQEKFGVIRRELSEALVERDGEVDLLLTALLASENLLLVGPPGTAKSLLLSSLRQATGLRNFPVLLTKFSTLEDVVGPISVKGLKEDQYRRILTGKLAEAELGFVDEIWKASSAILNTLLKILNERVYDNGDGVERPVPLRLCVAASNEWPSPETGKELAAIFDRFLLRKEVRPVATAAGRKRLLREGEKKAVGFSTSLSLQELDQAQAEAGRVVVTDQSFEMLEEILLQLRKEGVVPGDRRQVKALKVCRAAAWLEGSDLVEPNHLEVLAHVLWDDPQEQPRKAARVIASIANPLGMKVNSLLLEAEEVVAGADLRLLAQASACTVKLGNILKELKAIPKGNGRVQKAIDHISKQIKAVKLQSLEGL